MNKQTSFDKVYGDLMRIPGVEQHVQKSSIGKNIIMQRLVMRMSYSELLRRCVEKGMENDVNIIADAELGSDTVSKENYDIILEVLFHDN